MAPAASISTFFWDTLYMQYKLGREFSLMYCIHTYNTCIKSWQRWSWWLTWSCFFFLIWSWDFFVFIMELGSCFVFDMELFHFIFYCNKELGFVVLNINIETLYFWLFIFQLVVGLFCFQYWVGLFYFSDLELGLAPIWEWVPSGRLSGSPALDRCGWWWWTNFSLCDVGIRVAGIAGYLLRDPEGGIDDPSWRIYSPRKKH